jgi:hypothetical protein
VDRSRPAGKGVTRVSWESPSFIEVKMDAEINAYQDDFGPDESY